MDSQLILDLLSSSATLILFIGIIAMLLCFVENERNKYINGKILISVCNSLQLPQLAMQVGHLDINKANEER